MWRRMRGARDAHTGRPLIRPVGTHMLGPKQSLLLVDVAGEMVLLGTTDKGVQMLTKIEARDTDPHPRDARPAPVAAPAAAAEPQGFAARLGGALARFRTAAGHIDPRPPAPPAPTTPSPRFAARVRDTAPPPPTDDRATDRAATAPPTAPPTAASSRRRAPAATSRPSPLPPPHRPHRPQTDPAADLLQKIRRLQSA
ncbi:MAG: flagellar biosynthetic protein FliO [Myxococcales bacterium]|nr:flagellar biosynthetic protein FliO [Myxococcales bacterium]